MAAKEGRGARRLGAAFAGTVVLIVLAAGSVAFVVAAAMEVGLSWELLGLLGLLGGGAAGTALYRWGRARQASWRAAPGAVFLGTVLATSIAASSPLVRLVFVALLVSFLWAIAAPIFGPFVGAVGLFIASKAFRHEL